MLPSTTPAAAQGSGLFRRQIRQAQHAWIIFTIELAQRASEVLPTKAIKHLGVKKMGFSRTKDRVFSTYDSMSKWLAQRPKPMRTVAYKAFGGILWVAFLLPGNSVRPTMAGLAKHVGAPSALALFRKYVRNFVNGTELAERVRHGFGSELDGMLTIPDKDRLDALLEEGGVFLALPHLHASIAMTRCLAQSYPVLAVVSLTRDRDRAEAQRDLYRQVGCDFLDARGEEPKTVARKILQALKAGKIVAGTIDRIQHAPAEDVDKRKDIVRATAFGAPVGFGGWPTRFATKAGVPILPAIVEQTDGGVSLVIGKAVTPSADIVSTTQDWVTELEHLLRSHPQEWAFSLDKHWSRVLRDAHSD